MIHNKQGYEKPHNHLKPLKPAFTKRHLTSLILLITISLATMTFANDFLFKTANATYVEGSIARNTVWTLVDSPFVVSKNVTIYPNATLTIESGVEIKFGGDFSIIVEGQLVANGTRDKVITFTSNKDQPQLGDWGTIEFSSMRPSLLAYCSIEYAKTGVTLKNSLAEIKNSIIDNNQNYGVSVANSSVNIRNNEIANNSLSGVYISGNNLVTIRNNVIKSNKDGILLSGTSSSGIDISYNTVLSNTQSGINLNARAYSNLAILYNLVSNNQWGFYINSEPSTRITNNTISYNKIGFLYAAGQNHEAHWNNITNNELGMSISPALGSSSVYVEVLDSLGRRILSNTAVVSTIGMFSASISPGYANMTATESQVFSSTVYFGVAPFSYQWYLNGVPVSGATNPLWAFTPAFSGLYSVYAKVTDDVGMEAKSNTAVVSVNGAYSASISPVYSNSTGGQSQVFSSTVYFGVAPFSYQWYLNGVPAPGATNPTWTFTPSTVFSEIVNATYNYWGDESGPYHVSLNPYGKGNPVGGDGMSLDFIFFTTAPIGYADNYPTAWLWADKSTVAPNKPVTFFATNSMNDRNGKVDQYLYDFGDATKTGWTTLSVFVHNYTSPGTYYATVKVMDDFGLVSTNLASWTVKCEVLPSLSVSLTPDSSTVNTGQQAPLLARVTDAALSPVVDANVTLVSFVSGSFVTSFGLTNSSGYFATAFNAPNVTSITSVRIVATASKAGFADGSDHKYLLVQPPMTVSVSSSVAVINSGTISEMTVAVTYDGAPVSDALITLSSNSTGIFMPSAGFTNASGVFMATFSANVSVMTIVKIDAFASKAGLADGYGYLNLLVNPPLMINISPYAGQVNSGTASNFTFTVTYNGLPVPAANVTVWSDSAGTFDQAFGLTDVYGARTFVFTAPLVMTPAHITIGATATKTGHTQGANQTVVTLNLGALSVEVNSVPAEVESEATTQVLVHVSYYGQSVSNATVILFSDNGGAFYPLNAVTDANGNYTFTFTAPEASTESLVTIRAQATKGGYLLGQGQITITAKPASSPFLSLPVLIALIAIILVIAVVLILVKLKVIVISKKGE